MERSSEEYWLSLTLAVTLLLVWGVMSIARVYDRRLGDVNDSFTSGSRVIGRLGTIVDALDRLVMDERAFLSSDDETFQDGVIENAQVLDLNIAALNAFAARNPSQRAAALELARSVEQVIGIVSRSDLIMELRSRAEAAAFFASREDDISRAQRQADQLQVDIIGSISERIRNARRNNNTSLGTLLNDARRWQSSIRVSLRKSLRSVFPVG